MVISIEVRDEAVDADDPTMYSAELEAWQVTIPTGKVAIVNTAAKGAVSPYS